MGLVLGGGGVLGQAFHAGVLAAMDDAGCDPRAADLLLGTSAGSQLAAFLRAGVHAADLAASFGLEGPLSEEGERLLAPARAAAGIPHPGPRLPGWVAAPRLLARLAIRPWEARAGVLMAAALPPGRRSTERFVAGLDPLFGREWPDGLWITAVRLDTGRRVVFGAPGAPPASVGEAVAASCAIPGFFGPVVIGGVRYVDGGCHTPTNLDLLAGQGLDTVVVSSPMSVAGAPRSLAAMAAFRPLHSAELAWEAARVRRRGSRVVVLQPDAEMAAVMGGNSMDHRRVPAVAKAARELARRRLASEPLRTVRP